MKPLLPNLKITHSGPGKTESQIYLMIWGRVCVGNISSGYKYLGTHSAPGTAVSWGFLDAQDSSCAQGTESGGHRGGAPTWFSTESYKASWREGGRECKSDLMHKLELAQSRETTAH